jgi:hypothetical protein
MNEMNDLEKWLYSWTPRRPSARLDRRLFAARPAPAEALLPFRFGWLAPTTVALALMCVLLNQRYGAPSSAPTGASPMVAMILSNQSAAAYLPGSFQAEQNNLPADAFKWTRATSSPHPPVSVSRPKERD